MTPKRKPKSNSLIDVFFNNILFVKRYTFETPLHMYTVMTRLHELSDEKHGWLSRKSRFIVESEESHEHYVFDIRAKDRRHQYTISHATGTAYSTDSNGAIIEGEIRFGVVYFFMLLLSVLWMFFVFQYFGLHFSMWILGFAMITPTFTFVHMFYKRKQLISKIQSAITPRMTDLPIVKSKRRKGIHEVYAELEREFGYRFDDSSEQADYDQQ
jgi:hypothetical protein